MKNDFKIENRKARFNYFIVNTYRAGIVLKGSEVKSIRNGKINISESYCVFSNGELWLRNASIVSSNNIMFSHNEIYDRKLLLSKKELRKLEKASSIKGFTIVPLSVFVPENGYIKVNIALCMGKHHYDKRNAIKERDLEREMR